MKREYIWLIIGFVAGFVWLTGMRFFVAQPEEVHYHSNFAVYINGQRENFVEGSYYEEIQACTTAYADNPKGRTHMHDQKNDTIHVHDARVTYNNFFNNIGWSLGAEYIAAGGKLYVEDETNKVVYILNGEEVDNPANRVIGNLDRLLINYGPETAGDLTAKFDEVSHGAEETNKYQDPSSCQGLNGKGHNSFGTKLKRATFWAN